MNIEIPDYVQNLITELEENDYEAYVVGGAIRSALLHVEIHDYDLTTNALPQEMKQVFQKYRTIETGIQHGTLTVVSDHNPVEITTYRTDKSYLDHRHPDAVTFTRSLEEDCKRRDFTINALCYNKKTGLKDFFHGLDDLQNKTLRCIGDPDKRFDEDALRILRALRFAARLNFTIEENTAQAIHKNKALLDVISKERIHEELNGLLQAHDIKDTFLNYQDVFAQIIPAIKEYTPEQYAAAVEDMQKAETISNVRMALFLQFLSDPRSVLNDLKYSNADTKTILILLKTKKVSVQNKAETKYFLKDYEPWMDDILAYHNAKGENTTRWKTYIKEIKDKQEPYTLKQLAVTGKDLKQIGLKGKEIKETLDSLLQKVIEEKIPNTKEALLQNLKSIQ